MTPTADPKLEVASAADDPLAAPAPRHASDSPNPADDESPRTSRSPSDSPVEAGAGAEPRTLWEEDDGRGFDAYDYGSGDDDEDDGGSYSVTPPPRYVLQPGGVAARKAYDTAEIRQRILHAVDTRTQGRMLRLEKAAAKSVASVLFKSVNKAVMAKMSRANARRKIYCDAVLNIDRSPYPSLISGEKRPFKSDRQPVRFDHREALNLVAAGRKKFPNLQTIDYLFPSHEADDAWTIHIRGDKLSVHLQRTVEFDVHDIDLFNPEPPSLPRPPKLPEGMGLRYSIAIRLIARDDEAWLYWAQHKADLKAHLKKWHDWLYLNPSLDRRVVSIERWVYDYCNPADKREYDLPSHMYHPDEPNPKWRYPPIDPYDAPSIVDPTLDEALAFLAQRKRDGCRPMTSFTIPPSPSPITAERFREVVGMLNPEIRSLRVHKSIIQDLPSTQTAIAAFDAALPNLAQLAIVHDPHKGVKPKRSYVQRTPLSGLPKLRNFVSHIRMPGDIDGPQVGRYVCRLGTPKCVHQNLEISSMSGMKWGADEVHEVKPYVLDRRTYRYGDGYVMRPEEEDREELQETRVESEWGDYYVLE